MVKTFDEVMMYALLIDWFLAVFQLYHGVKKFHKLISSTRGPLEIKKTFCVYNKGIIYLLSTRQTRLFGFF